jgi:hypothetical protein
MAGFADASKGAGAQKAELPPKGVKVPMAALTPQERKEFARKAARARWANAKKKSKKS